MFERLDLFSNFGKKNKEVVRDFRGILCDILKELPNCYVNNDDRDNCIYVDLDGKSLIIDVRRTNDPTPNQWPTPFPTDIDKAKNSFSKTEGLLIILVNKLLPNYKLISHDFDYSCSTAVLTDSSNNLSLSVKYPWYNSGELI